MRSKEIKEIVAIFLKKSPKEIGIDTLIDNSAIPGSILIHRMYSELHAKGYIVNETSKIKTYGDLEKSLSNNKNKKSNNNQNKLLHSQVDQNITSQKSEISNTIGVDIESSDNLPIVDDYFEDQFYTDNFSKSEIAYCSLKSEPRSCFSGRFAAKEAIVKADNSFIGIKFLNIEIRVSSNGAPYFEGFSISISHLTNGSPSISVAIAQKLN